MKVAVTYENGMVFQHLGKCQNFLVLNIENNEIKERNLLSSGGNGHGALAQLLKQKAVDVLICGGIGQGARNALKGAQIQVIAGVTGNADVAVDAYLNGSLKDDPRGACNHHHEGEHHDCSHDHCQ